MNTLKKNFSAIVPIILTPELEGTKANKYHVKKLNSSLIIS